MHLQTDTLEEYSNTIVLNRNLKQIIGALLNKEVIYTAPTDTDLAAVHPSRFQVLNVPERVCIKEFVEDMGAVFKKGKGFYQLKKREMVQEHKEIVLRDKEGSMWGGSKARELVGLPVGSRGYLQPYSIHGYDVFIQSTSNNRMLDDRSQFLYEVA